MVNVDGFDATIQSEGLAPGGSYADPNDSGGTSGDQGVGTGAYKRKNCRKHPTDPNPLPEVPCLARTWPPGPNTNDRGVDLNRNYGVLWGGPGTSSDIDDLTFHGTGPFSEPETEAFRRFLRDIQPIVAIGNHTFTGLILRPPGTADQVGRGREPDARPGRQDGRSRPTTSRSSATSSTTPRGRPTTTSTARSTAYAYTPEIGKDEFHPAFTTGFIPEYEGRVIGGEQARRAPRGVHARRPDRDRLRQPLDPQGHGAGRIGAHASRRP